MAKMCFNLSLLFWKSVDGTDSTTGCLVLSSIRKRLKCPSGYGPSWSMNTLSLERFGMLVTLIGFSLSPFVATWR